LRRETRMSEKIIVTNRKALVKKYGNSGFISIQNALRTLVNADKKRGLSSKVVYLDNATGMKKLNCKPVKNSLDPHENKDTIDAIFKFFNPNYLLIVGSPDIVPHQDLDNPAFLQDGDDDFKALGDLPYACDAPYSQDPDQFVGPTRVMGRLPDLIGANEPSYIVTLLKTAANYTSRSPNDYTIYLGLSVEDWQGSTRLSMERIFGNSDKLFLSPNSGPNYPNGELRNRMHFINCHGAPSSPEFSGQHGKDYPVSLTTQSTIGEILEGTVAAAECCYGAELYDSVTLDIDKPICQSYLEQGGYGYFGSTTIAYGLEDTNGAADLICQYFMLNVLDGASLGRAALMARQQFVKNSAQMDAIDLKTLAQFCLFGDPSVHPIAEPNATKVPAGVAVEDAQRFFRTEDRAKMKIFGNFLSSTTLTASKQVPLGKITLTTKTALSNIVKLAGLPEAQKFTAFAVKTIQESKNPSCKVASSPTRYLVTIGTPQGVTNNKIKRGIAVVAKELNGRIIGYRIYHQH